MNSFDMVDRANFEQAKQQLRDALISFDDAVKLEICRDIAIGQISSTIEKFPLKTQKEILALLTDKYLNHWQSM